MGYNEQQHGKALGGYTSKPNKSVKNLAIKEALEDLGIGTNVSGADSVAIKDTGTMTQGGNIVTPDAATYQGGSTQYTPPAYDGYGKTPQAPRKEYFGPIIDWNPGVGNQYHAPDPVADYEKKVQAITDSGSVIDTKKIKKETGRWTPGSGANHQPDNILQAVYEPVGHYGTGGKDYKHAGQYLRDEYNNQPAEAFDPSIAGALKEIKGRDKNVVTTDDQGKPWRLPERDVRAEINLDKGLVEPIPDDIDITLTDEEIAAILKPKLVAPEDSILDKGGSFIEIDSEGPANRYGVTHPKVFDSTPWTPGSGPNHTPSVRGLDSIIGYDQIKDSMKPQPLPLQPAPITLKDLERQAAEAAQTASPIGSVSPEHMGAWRASVAASAPQGVAIPPHIYANQVDTTGVGEETVDLSGQNVPLNYDDRIQRTARAPRPQTERESQMELAKFYQSIGDNERAGDILRALGGNQPVGLKATLDSILK